MPSRQDQLHSYQFMVQRVVSALVLRETDPPQSPFRRAAGAAMASVLVAVIVAAGFGVYGVFTNRGDRSWRTEGAVIVEKGTGAVYVWRDNKLHPALNLASAYLASSETKPKKFEVSAKSLKDVPWGPTLGVPLLPDTLPDPKDLVELPWAVCSVPGKDAPASAVVLGSQPDVGGRVVADDEAIMVRSVVKSPTPPKTYMFWQGLLYETPGELVNNLAGGDVRPTPVSLAFVNGAGTGRALRKLEITGARQPFQKNPAWNVGQVIKVTGYEDDKYVVIRANDLAWVNHFQAALLGNVKDGSESISDLERFGTIKGDLLPGGTPTPQDPPTRRPRIATYNGAGLCSVVKDEAGNSELRADVKLDLTQRPATSGRSSDGAAYADYVVVPHGRGAIVSSGQAMILVAQNGVRYAAANPTVLAKLGYEGRIATRLPPALISLLPEGPGLDPQEALEPITVS